MYILNKTYLISDSIFVQLNRNGYRGTTDFWDDFLSGWCGRCIRSRIAIEIEVYIDKFKNKNKKLSINQIKIIQKKNIK